MAEILVVDSGELGELLVALLGLHGRSAKRARSGEQALEMALADRPRLAIIENDLPDVSGMDIAELLRAEMDVIVVLTYASGLLAGADDVLRRRLSLMDASFARPFQSLSLVECAARLLGGTPPTSDAAPALPRTEPQKASRESPLSVDLPSSEGAPSMDDLPDDSPEDLDSGAAVPDGASAAPPLEEYIVHALAAPGDLWRKVNERRGLPREHTQASKPGTQAPLSPRALVDMLDAFHQSQTTGELWLTHGSAKRVLLFRRGIIVGARSNLEAEELSTIALGRGVLHHDDVAAVRHDVLSGDKRTIVDAILGRDLLPVGTLPALIEEQARRIALGAFTWRSGGMRVTLEGRGAREPVTAKVPVGDLILRGILLTEGDDALLAAAPDDARFAPASDSGYGLEDLTLTDDEARAVIALDGTRMMADLIRLFAPRMLARTIRGVAAGLLCLNLLRFDGRGTATRPVVQS